MEPETRQGGTINGLALCAGIGGLELGIKRALAGRLRTVCFVERDPYAASVLVARMEDSALDRAPIWDDLKTFDGRAWRGKVDLISAGYPCQPFSQAGSRQGADDPRHLWPSVARIIREVGPRFVCLENVRGHLSLGFDRVLGDLADLGFDAEWETFKASDVGAPHRRERLFVLGYRNSARRLWSRGGPKKYTRREPQAGRCTVADGDSGRLEGHGLGSLQPQESESRDDVDGRGKWPLAWPPGPGGDWGSIPENYYPALESTVRRVDDGISTPLVTSTKEVDAERTNTEPGQVGSPPSCAEGLPALGTVRELQGDGCSRKTSSELRQRPDRDSLPTMPRLSGQARRDEEEQGASELLDLRNGIHSPTHQQQDLRYELRSRVRPGECSETVGHGSPDESVLDLQSNLSVPPQAGRDVRSGVRQDPAFPSYEEAMVYRADRLRCLGNAVVPAQAELAFRELFGWVIRELEGV